MFRTNITNQFHDQNGLAHTRATKQASLSTLEIRFEQINNLDAGFEHFHFGVLLLKFGCVTVNTPPGLGLNRRFLVNRVAHDIKDSP